MKFPCIKMSQYFPKPYEPFGGGINATVDMSNYAAKADLKDATRIDTSKLAAKPDLVSLNAEVDKLDVVKRTVYDKLVAKVNNIDTGGIV